MTAQAPQPKPEGVNRPPAPAAPPMRRGDGGFEPLIRTDLIKMPDMTEEERQACFRKYKEMILRSHANTPAMFFAINLPSS